ncbi:MAG: hypothetical protein ACJ73S_25855 [Mycobacteriales bacterium]
MSARDFDFLHGTWNSTQRRLAKRLAGSTEWDEFAATLDCRPVLGGLGNVDEMVATDRDVHGLTIRLYDPETDEWSIHWVSRKKPVMDPAPVVGRFVDGVGEFLADDEWEGTPIRCRYRWTVLGPTSARWEQAFSTDGGETWETNWIADFARVS